MAYDVSNHDEQTMNEVKDADIMGGHTSYHRQSTTKNRLKMNTHKQMQLKKTLQWSSVT